MPTFVAVTEVTTEKVRVEWTVNDWRLVMRFSDMEDSETYGPVIKMKQIAKAELRVSIAAIGKNRSEESLVPQIYLYGSEISTNSVLVMGSIGLHGPQNQEYGGTKIDRRVGVGEVIAGAPVSKSKILQEKLIVIVDLRITIKKPERYNNAPIRPDRAQNKNAEGDFCDIFERMNVTQGPPDFIIRVGEATFRAHKSILSKSDVFKSLIEQASKSKRKNTLEIANTNPEIWERFQNFLYTGQILLDKDHLDDAVALLVLSDKYHVTSLSEELAEKLKLAITKYNVLDVFDIAEHFNLNDLEKKSMEFLKINAEFFKTDKAEGLRKRIWNNPKLAELMFTRM